MRIFFYRMQDDSSRGSGSSLLVGSKVHPASVWATWLPAQRIHTRHHVRLQHPEAVAQRRAGCLQHVLHFWKEKEVHLALRTVFRQRRRSNKQPHLQLTRQIALYILFMMYMSQGSCVYNYNLLLRWKCCCWRRTDSLFFPQWKLKLQYVRLERGATHHKGWPLTVAVCSCR